MASKGKRSSLNKQRIINPITSTLAAECGRAITKIVRKTVSHHQGHYVIGAVFQGGKPRVLHVMAT
ncbi:hypothetical protein DAQ1742_03928 [Dickeya aquatica]|uniref:Uncharacterized protein n=1 Tax=Dickeya aquatica TaxID=1401087 RepID=A0A375AGH6_9GAMM|nr:hypothetical protein DAQ1742_03928 [Dickeya aquatica]